MAKTKLAEAWEVGKSYQIKELFGNLKILGRLWELGFTKGESLTVLHKAPFGGPVVVKVRATSVALREVELKCIQIL